MSRSWIDRLAAQWLGKPNRAGRAAARRATRLRVESLEDRTTPTAYTVTSLADDGSAGTLRSALSKVNLDGGTTDTITFALAGSVALTSPLQTISGHVTIMGSPAGNTISGASASQGSLVTVASGGNVTLMNLTISGGTTRPGTAAGSRTTAPSHLLASPWPATRPEPVAELTTTAP